MTPRFYSKIPNPKLQTKETQDSENLMGTFVIHLAGKQKKRMLLANSNNHISEPDSSRSCLSQPLPSGVRGVMGRRNAMVRWFPSHHPLLLPCSLRAKTTGDESVSQLNFIFFIFLQELFISELKKKMEFYWCPLSVCIAVPVHCSWALF